MYPPPWSWSLSNNQKDFSEIDGDIHKCNFLNVVYSEKCQHLEDPHNSVSQYFPNDQLLMFEDGCVKDPFKVEDRPVCFNY